MDITADFLSIGGNRNPAAADWDPEDSALLAFGADNSVALWEPQVGLALAAISVQDEDALTVARILNTEASGR
jgi:hypothetical protein